MDKWKAVMLDGKVQSRKVAAAFLAEHGDHATARAASLMREARKRRRASRALHWSRVAMWIEELRKDKKDLAVKRVLKSSAAAAFRHGDLETRPV